MQQVAAGTLKKPFCVLKDAFLDAFAFVNDDLARCVRQNLFSLQSCKYSAIVYCLSALVSQGERSANDYCECKLHGLPAQDKQITACRH